MSKTTKAEKVLCQTPTPGKKPTRIDRWKYDLISETILKILPESGAGILFKDLPGWVSQSIDEGLKEEIGSIGWYTTTVKLDLECRNRIARVKGRKPQALVKVSQGNY